MFSSQIVTADEFLEMPLTSQALYFHLGMSADDDGFVSPRKVLRMTGAGEDDIKNSLSPRASLYPFNLVSLSSHIGSRITIFAMTATLPLSIKVSVHSSHAFIVSTDWIPLVYQGIHFGHPGR